VKGRSRRGGHQRHLLLPRSRPADDKTLARFLSSFPPTRSWTALPRRFKVAALLLRETRCRRDEKRAAFKCRQRSDNSNVIVPYKSSGVSAAVEQLSKPDDNITRPLSFLPPCQMAARAQKLDLAIRFLFKWNDARPSVSSALG